MQKVPLNLVEGRLERVLNCKTVVWSNAFNAIKQTITHKCKKPCIYYKYDMKIGETEKKIVS